MLSLWATLREGPKCQVCRRQYAKAVLNLRRDVRLGDLASSVSRECDVEFEVSVESLQESVRRGCPGCQVLTHVIAKLTGKESESTGVGGILETIPMVFQLRYISPSGLSITLPDRNEAHEVYPVSKNHPLSSESIPSQTPTLVELNPISVECFKRLQTWIGDCKAHHNMCKQESFVPRRLLDLFPPGSDRTDSLILIEKTGDTQGPYTALSYCWGKKVPFKTTLDTYESRTSEILFSSLPKTLQDAVTITRRLQVRYLWIDSLCIIQDDQQDWMEQSGQMAYIYTAAYVTIAAATGKDVFSGILNDRSSTAYDIFTPTTSRSRPMVQSRIMPSSWWGQRHSRHMCYYQWDPAQKDVLMTRGWAFQERMLSTRVVHYTSTEMIFECNQSTRCECALDTTATTRKSLKSDQQLTASQLLAGNPTEKYTAVRTARGARLRTKDRKAMCDWFRIVEFYSTLGLTTDTDNLPALSGLAHSFALRAENDGSSLGTYYAGLWRRHFPYNLLWYATGGSAVRTSNYGAPTWSWASMASEIKFELSDPDDAVDIKRRTKLMKHHVKCSLTGQDPFGQVKSGFLIAEACIWPGDGPFAELLGSVWRNVNIYFDGKAIETQNMPVYFMEVLGAWSTGLLLRPVAPAQYERIGFYKFWRALSAEEQSWRSKFSLQGTIKIV